MNTNQESIAAQDVLHQTKADEKQNHLSDFSSESNPEIMLGKRSNKRRNKLL